jgi:hypothetical protein
MLDYNKRTDTITKKGVLNMPLFETIDQLATAIGPSIVNAISQHRTNQSNYQNQLKLQSRAHGHQRTMFNLTNAYSTLLNQVKRFKEAVLKVNLQFKV